MNKNVFDSVALIFNRHGYRLYMVGGATRDYLLDRPILDYDFVTDATPEEMKAFLPEADYTFSKFGTVRIKVNHVKVDITTLRIEDGYIDFRHPSKVVFTKDIKKDYVRRDFTINAIYMDEEYNIIDYCGGLNDLNNKLIRFIGDPDKRIKEDPLRILRAERFEKKLGFKIEDETFKAIERNRHLIEELNPQKVQAELKKMENDSK
jgi:tRNA nucleotidyltransferase (CCA-adding enzyme)